MLVPQIEVLVRTVRFDCLEKVGICRSSNQPDECGTKRFFRWSGRRAIVQTHPSAPKMPWAPSAFPQKWAPQAPGDRPSPSQEGKSLGKRSPEVRGCWSRRTSTNCHWNRNTPNQIRVLTNAADRSESQPSNSQRLVHMLYSAGRKSP